MKIVRRKLFWYRRWLKFHIFGVKRFNRRIPRKGQSLKSCCDGKIKKVSYSSVFEDTIEYEDGSSDSLANCGWQPVVYDR